MLQPVPPWLAVMRSLDGTHAEGDNPAILAWPKFIAQAYPDMASYCAGYTHDSISWCGLTIAYCMAKAGIRPVFGPSDTDRFLWALAWLEFGTVVEKGDEQPGDVLVFVWASGGHHVTLYEGTDGTNYICHGGNQSHAVNTQHYSQAYCRGIRRPPAVAAVKPVSTLPAAQASATLPPAAMLPPLLSFAEEAAALVARQLIAASPRAAAEAVALRAKLMIARDVADAAIGLLDKVAPMAGQSGAPAAPLRLPGLPSPAAPPALPAPAPAAPGQHFMACVTLVLQSEGGNDDDPRDPGGRTSRGILQSEWDIWRQTHPGLPSDVWQAPQDQVLAIYQANYWNVLACDSLPIGVDYAVFDYGVNSGNGRAAKALQGLVGAAADGEIGPNTIAATAHADPATLIGRLCDQRLAFLQSLSTWPTFGHGWTNRVQGVRSAALAMATSSPASKGVSAMPDNTNVPQTSVPPFLVNAWANRKTTIAGFIPIGMAVLDLLNQYSSGHWDLTHLQADLAAFGIGGGFIVAKDAGK